MRARSRWRFVAAVSGLILVAGAVPGGAADGDEFELHGPDPSNLEPGQIARVAGTGDPVEESVDDDSDGGPAGNAPLGEYLDVAVGEDGTVYIADESTGRLRTVDSEGTIDTLSDDARDLGGPWDVSVGSEGDAFVAYGDTVQRVSPKGDFTKIAGGGKKKALYANGGDGGDGGPAAKASVQASGVDVGPDGTVYIVDANEFHDRIRTFTEGGEIITIAGGGDQEIDTNREQDATGIDLFEVFDVVVDSKGVVYYAARDRDNGHYVGKVTPDGTLSVVVDDFSVKSEEQGRGLAVDAEDNLLYADLVSHVVRRIGPDGTITTVAAYPATDTDLMAMESDSALAVGPDGNLYTASQGQVMAIGMNADGLAANESDEPTTEAEPGEDPWAGDNAGAVKTVADDLSTPRSLTVGADGSVFVVTGDPEKPQLVTVSPDGEATTRADAADVYPFGAGVEAVEAAADGNIYLASVRGTARVDRDGAVSMVAGPGRELPETYEGQLTSTVGVGVVTGMVSVGGTLYTLSEQGTIHQLTADGTVNVVAEGVTNGLGSVPFAADPDGNVYVYDSEGNKILKIDSSGTVATFAGTGAELNSLIRDDNVDEVLGDDGPAVEAEVAHAQDVAVHPDGAVYISGFWSRIRAVGADGIIDTVADFHSSDESSPDPDEIAFDSHGNLYFTDSDNGRVMVLVRPADISHFPWWMVWTGAAVVVAAGAAVLLIRRRRRASDHSEHVQPAEAAQ